MNNLDKNYIELLEDILANGTTKKDRTGTGTISVFGRTIRHKMSEGFPLLTTKKMYTRGIVVELIWFLKGETNIKYLVDNDCNIWNNDAYNFYKRRHKEICDNEDFVSMEKFIENVKNKTELYRNDGVPKYKFGDLGPIYGNQWRSWKVIEFDESKRQRADSVHNYYDQIEELIKKLKNSPDDRRMMVTAWNPHDVQYCALPPCHYGFQCWTRELSEIERNSHPIAVKARGEFRTTWTVEQLDTLNVPKRAISLSWNQRSVDTFLGLPFNIASYGLLLSILGEIVNMVPEDLIGNLGDTHLYLNHLEQAKEQISRKKLTIQDIRNLYPEYDDILKRKHEAIKSQKYEEAVSIRDEERDWIEKTKIEDQPTFELPQLVINSEFWTPALSSTGECPAGAGNYTDVFEALIMNVEIDDFQIENYKSHPSIKAPLSN